MNFYALCDQVNALMILRKSPLKFVVQVHSTEAQFKNVDESSDNLDYFFSYTTTFNQEPKMWNKFQSQVSVLAKKNFEVCL